jgi:ribosomal RNA-processing protein 12
LLYTSEAVSDYFLTVLAGLAGSAHMVSATLLALSRLVYEFHGKYQMMTVGQVKYICWTDLLGAELIKRLLSSTCVFLSSKSREVVRATLEFIKVTIGVLPAAELIPHVQDMVRQIGS